MLRRSRYIIILVTAVGLLLSCGRDRRGVEVAKAGSSSLTAEELAAFLPEGFQSYFGDDALLFVEQWVDEVILAEAAMDLKLESRPEVAERLAEARRMILASAFEQYHILPMMSIDSAEIGAYYHNNTDQFIRENDEVMLYHIMVVDEETRDSVVALIDSVSFDELAERFSIDPMSASLDNAEFLARDQIHPSISRRAFAMTKGEVSGPIETEFGYHFIMLVDFAPKGSIRQFSEVRDGISDYLAEQRFQEIYTEILDSLRNAKQIMIDTNAILRTLKQHEN
ncbi:MAG TPA: hypothetical protein ENN07_05205 [candidate division Zixibacteria bacterium]|nr:hypothetical protein [candidate division Zixibacteria bacterium]